jgi:hypothetical protein
LSSTDVDSHYGSEQDLKNLIATARKKGECTQLSRCKLQGIAACRCFC